MILPCYWSEGLSRPASLFLVEARMRACRKPCNLQVLLHGFRACCRSTPWFAYPSCSSKASPSVALLQAAIHLPANSTITTIFDRGGIVSLCDWTSCRSISSSVSCARDWLICPSIGIQIPQSTNSSVSSGGKNATFLLSYAKTLSRFHLGLSCG